MMVSSGCIPMWKNGRSRRYLEESYFNKCFRRKTHKKTGISINIVTSEHDMFHLVRKFRESEDMPQRSFQKHRSYAIQQDSFSKTPNVFGCNLRLPTIHDHFDDGNHQEQVSMLYRIFFLKTTTTKFEFKNDRLSCFQKAVSICLLLRRQQKIKTCRQ